MGERTERSASRRGEEKGERKEREEETTALGAREGEKGVKQPWLQLQQNVCRPPAYAHQKN